MLRNSFYSIVQQALTADAVEAEIKFNVEHPIFAGHFPGQPVVPGVCMMQIVKDLTEDLVRSKLTLTDGENIKFLSIIDPQVDNVVHVTLRVESNNDLISVNGSFFNLDVIFFKFKGIYSR